MFLNIGYSFFSLIFKAFMSIGIFIILARVLSVDDYGAISLAYSFSIICSALAEYGYNFLVLKELNRQRIKNIFWKILFQKFSLSILVIIFIIFYTFYFFADKSFYIFLLISLSGVLFSFTTYSSSAIKSKSIFLDEVKIFGLQVLALGLTLSWLIYNDDITSLSFAVSFFLCRLLGALYSVKLALKHFPLTAKLAKQATKDQRFIFREGSIYGLHIVIAVAYFQIDTQLIGYFVDNASVGFYQNAVRFIVIGMMVSEVLMQVMLPKLVHAYMIDKKQFASLARLASNTLQSVVISYILILSVFDEEIVTLLYGEYFVNITSFTWAIILVCYLRCIANIYGLSSSLSDKPILRIFAVFFILVISVLLNYLLIPKYGYEVSFYIQAFVHIVLVSIYMYITYMIMGDSLVTFSGLVYLLIVLLLSHTIYIGNIPSLYLLFFLPIIAINGTINYLKFEKEARLI
ncbi:oligosaccharide flippase family protein [Gammaproteobacteria bacterium]|nr:oligosaccharide flippase family protein [Gammaproteobacteria bacterium]